MTQLLYCCFVSGFFVEKEICVNLKCVASENTVAKDEKDIQKYI